ncbi:MAG: hypothetical protein RI894_1568, partial [Bacteroidota bacterium]
MQNLILEFISKKGEQATQYLTTRYLATRYLTTRYLKNLLVCAFLLIGLQDAEAKLLPKYTDMVIAGGDFIPTGSYSAPVAAMYQAGLSLGSFQPITVNTPSLKTSILTTIDLGLVQPSVPLNYDFDLTITVKFTAYKLDGSITQAYQDLTLSYKHDALKHSNIGNVYAMRDVYAIDNLSIGNVTATGGLGSALLNELARQVQLTLNFQEERVLAADYQTVVQPTHCYNEMTGELAIMWTPTPPPTDFDESYEVEYLFVDDYAPDGSPLAPSDIEYDFAQYAIRVTTKQPFYRLPLLFERGYLVYRVRIVGIGGAYLDRLVFCQWSNSQNTGTVDMPYNNGTAYYIDHDHNEYMNWQVKTTYAEEGKRSDVIAYYDGTYRARQTVTGYNLPVQPFNGIDVAKIWRDNCGIEGASREIIAGETIYDFQGRPAVNVLPAPTNQTLIAFIPQLNRNMSGAAYSYTDFDKKVTCGVAADAMDNNPIATNNAPSTDPIMGAAGYYSDKNSNKIGFNAFIPDAQGFPFSQVVYMSDNTGRIAQQGSVGQTFQIGGGHETKFLYGAPDQAQLDRLFGTEVGDAKRYQRHATIDPNGQIAVTYINPEGKTIATALAGEAPANLQALGENAAVPLSASLLPKNDTSFVNHQVTNEHAFIVTSANTQYTIDYLMHPDTVKTMFCDSSYCLDCVYDIAFNLVHQEACDTVPLWTYSGTIGNLLNPSDSTVDVHDCANFTDAPFAQNYTVTLQPGTYSLTKTLTVNQAAMEKYVERIMQDTCRRQWNQILANQWSQVDTMDCYQVCTNCNPLPTPPATPACNTTYCSTENPNRCDIIKQMMLADMSPGGQYGRFRDTTYITGTAVLTPDPTSILNPSNIFGINIYNNPAAQFNGHSAANATDLVHNWRVDFADTLLQYHPEYCSFGWCLLPETNAALNFTMQVLGPKTYADAAAAGFINTTNPAAQYLNLLALDTHLFPLNSTERSDFLNKIEHTFGCVPTGTATTYTIQQEAILMAYCQAQQPPVLPTTTVNNNTTITTGINTTMNTNSSNFCFATQAAADAFLANPANSFASGTTAELDRKWTMLRTLYLGLREEFINNSMNAYATTNHCNEDCIGNPGAWYLAPIVFGFPPIPVLSYQAAPPCNGNAVIFQTKKRRMGGSTQQQLEDILHQAHIHVTGLDNNGTNNLSPCQLGQLIVDSAATISTQAHHFLTDTTITCVPTYTNTALIAFLNVAFVNGVWANPALLNTISPIPVNTAGIPPLGTLGISNNAAATTMRFFSFPTGSINIPNGGIGIEIWYGTGESSHLCRYIFGFTNAAGYTAAQIQGGIAFAQVAGNNNLVHATVHISGTTTPVAMEAITGANFSAWSCHPMYQCTTTIHHFDDTLTAVLDTIYTNPCVQSMTAVVMTNTQTLYNQWLTELTNALRQHYNAKCLAALEEKYQLDYENKEYHYTLYYYDQAGNLVKTVPPAGFNPLPSSQFADVDAKRKTGQGVNVPQHTMATVYHYNSLNQVTWQRTPDAGLSTFYYDGLGRVAAAQNAKQAAEGTCAYTYYDAHGRTVEAGKVAATAATLAGFVSDYANWKTNLYAY